MNREAEILARVETIPALPSAAVEVIDALLEAQCSLERLTHTVECDPALTANLLRLANSALFGYHRRIGSVRDAMVRLGTSRVHDLVVAAALEPRVNAEVTGYDLPPGVLWLRSVAVGVGTAELARSLGCTPSCSPFVAGLLADVGKIALGSFVKADADEILRLAFTEGLPFQEAERRVLGIHHAEVGATLLDRWHLPEALVEAVRWHHEPSGARDPMAAYLVHAADALCMMLGLCTGIDGLHYQFAAETEGYLGLTTNVIDQVLPVIQERVVAVQRSFRYPTAMVA